VAHRLVGFCRAESENRVKLEHFCKPFGAFVAQAIFLSILHEARERLLQFRRRFLAEIYINVAVLELVIFCTSFAVGGVLPNAILRSRRML